MYVLSNVSLFRLRRRMETGGEKTKKSSYQKSCRRFTKVLIWAFTENLLSVWKQANANLLAQTVKEKVKKLFEQFSIEHR